MEILRLGRDTGERVTHFDSDFILHGSLGAVSEWTTKRRA